MAGQVVVNGAMLQYTFGAAPSALTVLPVAKVMASSQPAATIMDSKPMANIKPFGMCMSPTNPQVAAATAAAMGVLTPQPCIPATASPWTPGTPTVTIGGQPVLTNVCKCMCTWGGVISVTANPNMTVQA